MAEPKIPGGYYIKARVIQNSAIINKPPCVREIWDYLLMNANHKDAVLRGGIRIKRGQLLRRYERIIDDLSWMVGWRKKSYDENQVKKAMKFLRESLMIDSRKEPGGVLITIINYDLYQNPENYERTDDGTEDRTIDEPLENQSVPTYDKKKEECKEEELREGQNPTDKESLPVDQMEKQDPPLSEKTDSPQQGEAKPPAPPKPAKKKNGIILDLSSVDSAFDIEVVEEFIEYRKNVKKDPLTQRALNGACRNAKKTSEEHGGSFNDALVYAMENKWLTPDPKYVSDNVQRYRSFLDDQNGPTSEKKEMSKKIEDLKRRAQIAQEKWEREHRAVDA